MRLAILGDFREFDNIAGFIFDACARAVQAERHGLVGDELQVAGIEFQSRAFLGTAWNQTHRAHGVFIAAAQANEIRARQAATHQQSLARGADVGIISRAHRHRERRHRQPHHIGKAEGSDRDAEQADRRSSQC